ncbi:hypothetical protein LIER_02873 [Lithospermum erythrorhizon]|uniref:Alpha-L-fucosidase n=1 Tax=Lithospermum erythrorhizon TaxID=34254 RepID=A0AAV3NS80_LITER
MDDTEWVLVKEASDKDVWKPSGDDEESSSSGPLEVVFKHPAKHWTDALPIGNGRLGAMVWGAVPSETINLNEDTLWTGTPGNYTNPDAPKTLTEVRKLVDARKYAEATEAAVALSHNPSDVYQLLGDMIMEFDDSLTNYKEETYERVLDLDSATISVKYTRDNIDITREHFASNPDQVIATKISASKPGTLNFTVHFDSKMHHSSYVNDKNQIVMEGSCPGKRIQPKLNQNDNPKGIQFSAVLDLQTSGEEVVVNVVDGRKLQIKGCDWAVMLLVASSSFDGPFTNPSYSKRDPTSESLSTMNSVKKFSYSELYARHVDDYQKIFHRVSLQLKKSSKSNVINGPTLPAKISEINENKKLPTSERVKSFRTDEDPTLVELLFHYGRYLLIACSRPETQPANLQGIWNKDVEPPWDGAPHLNINLQMNYWPALPCNLKECQEPLFDYASSLSINGSKTAKVNYGASGWVVHQVSDIWAKTSPDRGQAVWALWQMGGAWLCTHLWEHFTYTMDKGFLEKIGYPLLESSASFLVDWLIDGPGGYLETNPSTSPEHTFIAPDGKPASVSYSSTMDIAIIKEIFATIVSAAKVLGKTQDDLIQRVHKAQERLPPYKIARDGSLMEWALDFQDPEMHHRHVSHLFGLFPGHTITVEKTPDLCKAVRNTLYKRGEEGPGWSTTWKACLWARLHDSEHAYRMVKHLFDLVDPDHEANFEGGLYSNLFTAHPPFQIDANFGFSAAIAEMLVQSTTKDLYLLPALPRDKWANGCVKGLKARGGVTVSICWAEGDLHEVGLWSKNQNVDKMLHYRGNSVKATLSTSRVYTFNKHLKCVRTGSIF